MAELRKWLQKIQMQTYQININKSLKFVHTYFSISISILTPPIMSVSVLPSSHLSVWLSVLPTIHPSIRISVHKALCKGHRIEMMRMHQVAPPDPLWVKSVQIYAWGGRIHSLIRPLASQRSIPLHSTPLRTAPLAGTFVSEKMAMY